MVVQQSFPGLGSWEVNIWINTLCFLQVILLTFFYFVIWLCFTVVYSMITTVYIQLSLGCSEYDDRRNLGNTCTQLYEASESLDKNHGPHLFLSALSVYNTYLLNNLWIISSTHSPLVCDIHIWWEGWIVWDNSQFTASLEQLKWNCKSFWLCLSHCSWWCLHSIVWRNGFHLLWCKLTSALVAENIHEYSHCAWH